MSYKIAVASSDGKVVNQHFGRSGQFLVFEVSDSGEYRFAELRENTPPCGFGEHQEDGMQRTVALLADCSAVLVSRIGPGAEQALREKNIKAFTITDYIDEALLKLINYLKKQKI